MLLMDMYYNCSKQCNVHRNNTEIFSQLFYIYFFIIAKPPGCSSLFFHISMGHAHFVNNEIHISCDPDSPTYMKVLFSCITPEKWAKKAKLKVLWQVATPGFSTQKRNPPLRQSLWVQELIEVCFAFIMCMQVVFTT